MNIPRKFKQVRQVEARRRKDMENHEREYCMMSLGGLRHPATFLLALSGRQGCVDLCLLLARFHRKGLIGFVRIGCCGPVV
jgi:hypothetical protein